MEFSEIYKNEVEVIVKVSGGRVLCGIYYFEFEVFKFVGWLFIFLLIDVILINLSSV